MSKSRVLKYVHTRFKADPDLMDFVSKVVEGGGRESCNANKNAARPVPVWPAPTSGRGGTSPTVRLAESIDKGFTSLAADKPSAVRAANAQMIDAQASMFAAQTARMAELRGLLPALSPDTDAELIAEVKSGLLKALRASVVDSTAPAPAAVDRLDQQA